MSRVCLKCGKQMGCYIGNRRLACFCCFIPTCAIKGDEPISHGLCEECLEKEQEKQRLELFQASYSGT